MPVIQPWIYLVPVSQKYTPYTPGIYGRSIYYFRYYHYGRWQVQTHEKARRRCFWRSLEGSWNRDTQIVRHEDNIIQEEQAKKCKSWTGIMPQHAVSFQLDQVGTGCNSLLGLYPPGGGTHIGKWYGERPSGYPLAWAPEGGTSYWQMVYGDAQRFWGAFS